MSKLSEVSGCGVSNGRVSESTALQASSQLSHQRLTLGMKTDIPKPYPVFQNRWPLEYLSIYMNRGSFSSLGAISSHIHIARNEWLSGGEPKNPLFQSHLEQLLRSTCEYLTL